MFILSNFFVVRHFVQARGLQVLHPPSWFYYNTFKDRTIYVKRSFPEEIFYTPVFAY